MLQKPWMHVGVAQNSAAPYNRAQQLMRSVSNLNYWITVVQLHRLQSVVLTAVRHPLADRIESLPLALHSYRTQSMPE